MSLAGRVGFAVVGLLVTAAAAAGQNGVVIQEYKAPQPPPPMKSGLSDEQVRQMNNNAMKSTEQQQKQVEFVGDVARTVFGLLLGAAVLVVGLVVCRYLLRPTPTTDPAALAATDPWIRARLREQEARDESPAG